MAEDQKAWDNATIGYLMIIEVISGIMAGRVALFLSAGNPHSSDIAWGAALVVCFSLLAITLIGWNISAAIYSLQQPTGTEMSPEELDEQRPPDSA